MRDLGLDAQDVGLGRAAGVERILGVDAVLLRLHQRLLGDDDGEAGADPRVISDAGVGAGLERGALPGQLGGVAGVGRRVVRLRETQKVVRHRHRDLGREIVLVVEKDQLEAAEIDVDLVLARERHAAGHARDVRRGRLVD